MVLENIVDDQDKNYLAEKKTYEESKVEIFDLNQDDSNQISKLLTPNNILNLLPSNKYTDEFIRNERDEIRNILHHHDQRILVIVGPCSIHDLNAAIDYAKLLKNEVDKHKSDLKIIMRAYFAKPRTVIGWKGLINDPGLNKSYNVNEGLLMARKFLKEMADLRLGVGTEILDPFSQQFISDLISWTAIGARTVESPIHREIASSLSMPVGFKNGTSGDIQVAVDGCRSAKCSHCFFGIDMNGMANLVHSKGNNDVHVILRGGKNETNYSAASIEKCSKLCKDHGISSGLIIDCSHDNSKKIGSMQVKVCEEVCKEIEKGNTDIAGIMIESFLHRGNQPLPNLNLAENDLSGDVHSYLKYGVSITDECISFEETVDLLNIIAASSRKRRTKFFDCN